MCKHAARNTFDNGRDYSSVITMRSRWGLGIPPQTRRDTLSSLSSMSSRCVCLRNKGSLGIEPSGVESFDLLVEEYVGTSPVEGSD
jgi:hypothetical protein